MRSLRGARQRARLPTVLTTPLSSTAAVARPPRQALAPASPSPRPPAAAATAGPPAPPDPPAEGAARNRMVRRLAGPPQALPETARRRRRRRPPSAGTVQDRPPQVPTEVQASGRARRGGARRSRCGARRRRIILRWLPVLQWRRGAPWRAT